MCFFFLLGARFFFKFIFISFFISFSFRACLVPLLLLAAFAHFISLKQLDITTERHSNQGSKKKVVPKKKRWIACLTPGTLTPWWHKRAICLHTISSGMDTLVPRVSHACTCRLVCGVARLRSDLSFPRDIHRSPCAGLPLGSFTSATWCLNEFVPRADKILMFHVFSRSSWFRIFFFFFFFFFFFSLALNVFTISHPWTFSLFFF